MVTVARSTVIDAPIDAVWRMLRDFNGHDRWHPAVKQSHLESGKRTDQVGAIRAFVLASGEHLREQLLSLSDRRKQFRYAIVTSDVPLYDYVAEVFLKPVTDGNRTFWSWKSSFKTPRGREQELSELVANGVYAAGFEAIRQRLESNASSSKDANRQVPQIDSDRYTSERTRVITSSLQGAGSVASSTSAAMPGRAIMIDRYGDADVMKAVDVSAPKPGLGEVRIRQTVIGVNFIDIYCRSGYFKLIIPPGVPGMEAAGEVVDVGADVRHIAKGQRVAYACAPVGAYTSIRTMDASLVIALPDDISDEIAAAALLKGMSAEFLLHRVHPLQRGETVLIFAPVGGVGSLLCQWAHHLGATVIGATSSQKKARIARTNGADYVLLPGAISLEDQILQLTDGRGVDVIYDAVGRDTFAHSLAALAPTGHLVSFGQASGDIGSWDIGSLASSSVTLSRPNFTHYTDTPEKVSSICERLFDAIRNQILRVDIGERFALEQAASAHRALESRATTGSTILIAS
ncbi:MAG: hypothetical protein DHS20C01_37520 [marine bacterium B5-7]|nr:MAG: hypothetical protein DHS20C01_37520 [marine bacterium B5-7]